MTIDVSVNLGKFASWEGRFTPADSQQKQAGVNRPFPTSKLPQLALLDLALKKVRQRTLRFAASTVIVLRVALAFRRVIDRARLNDILLIVIDTVAINIHAHFDLVLLAITDVTRVECQAVLTSEQPIN